MKRDNRTHYTIDGRTKKSFTEKDAIYRCYKLNSSDFSIHQVVAYKCIKCGMFHIGHTNVELTNDKKEDYRKRLKLL